MSDPNTPRYIGNYEVIGTLGRGGMGIVYRARDHALQRDLAIKVQSGDWEHHPKLFQRFIREARILAQINHPHVVQIYAVGDHEGSPYFAMELLEGSVSDAVRSKRPSVVQARRWMLEAARGLAAIHEKDVVHRDIKPGNLLLTRPSSVEPEHVKVADLGIASAGTQFGAGLTRAGAVLGTTGYLPPESFRLEHSLDGRADQYSLGVVFFEILAGRSPYTDMSDQALLAAILEPRMPPDVREFRSEVDAATAAIVSRMLRDDPAERFPSTVDLVEALAAAHAADPATRAQQRDGATAVMAPPLPAVSRAPVAAPTPPPPPPAARPVVPAAPAPVIAATTSRAQNKPPSRIGIVLGTVLATVVVGFIALAMYGSTVETPKETPKAENANVVPSPASGQETAPPSVASPLPKEAWAKYLLGRYQLRTRADGKPWILTFSDQDDGEITAELVGPDLEPIELTGEVRSQHEETIDGEDWDVYEVSLEDGEGTEVEVRFEFAEEQTAGHGSYRYDGERLRFDVLSWDEGE